MIRGTDAAEDQTARLQYSLDTPGKTARLCGLVFRQQISATIPPIIRLPVLDYLL